MYSYGCTSCHYAPFILTAVSYSIVCCCCSVAQLCLTCCCPTDCGMPGLPVPHHCINIPFLWIHFLTDGCLNSFQVFAIETSEYSVALNILCFVSWLYMNNYILEWNYGTIEHICKLLQSCVTLCDPMDCNQPGSSVRGVLQERVFEWVTILLSRGFLDTGNEPASLMSLALAGRFFTINAMYY